MEAIELRQFSADELKGRIKQWQDELFRARFKSQSTEGKDTSIFVKLRRDIARGKTILVEKMQSGGKVESVIKSSSVSTQEVQNVVKTAKKVVGTTKKATAKKSPGAKRIKGSDV